MHRAWPQDPHQPQCCAKCTMSDIPKELLEGGAAGWQLSPYSIVMPTVILESMADGEATTRESHPKDIKAIFRRGVAWEAQALE